MDITKTFNIPFKGLGTGKHRFDYDIDSTFFASFDNSEITGGETKVVVDADKASSSMVLNVGIEGHVTVECDRCLEDCMVPIDYKGTLTVKSSDKLDGDEDLYDGEVLWLNTTEGELNIAQYVYESIVLSLPYQRVHPEDENGNPTCNTEMLDRFRIVTEEEFDEITAPEEQKMADNPEWDKLKALKEEMEKQGK